MRIPAGIAAFLGFVDGKRTLPEAAAGLSGALKARQAKERPVTK